MSRSLLFLYFPGCEILDFAGPLQAFYEANQLGAGYRIEAVGTSPSVATAQGLTIAGLSPLSDPAPGTLLLVPGFQVGQVSPPPEAIRWLARCGGRGVSVAAICTGAFLAGAAGLLAGRTCTTHWKRTAELQAAFPEARVVEGRLFVEDGPVLTSGGLSSGIDLSLHLIEQDRGPSFAARVAREMVVYLRRDGSQDQVSPFLEHRNHLHPAVHRVQDQMVSRPEVPWTIEALSQKAALSPRHLTRTFRKETGIGIRDYLTEIRIEKARTLLAAGELTVEAVASAVGFSDGRQLRRLWHQRLGTSPRTAPSKPGGVTGGESGPWGTEAQGGSRPALP